MSKNRTLSTGSLRSSVSAFSNNGIKLNVTLSHVVINNNRSTKSVPEEDRYGTLKFLIFCVIVIIVSFALLGLVIYVVKEAKEKVLCRQITLVTCTKYYF